MSQQDQSEESKIYTEEHCSVSPSVKRIKTLTVSIICVFLNYIIMVNVFYAIQQIVLAILLLLINYVYNLKEEKDERHQFWESVFLGWLTITNLGKGKTHHSTDW